MPDEICRQLPWDSDFFGLRIARFVPAHLSEQSAQSAIGYCHEQRIDCLYLLLEDDRASLDAAAANGFQYVDTRITLSRSLSGYSAPTGRFLVRTAKSADVAELVHIARTSYHHSRFYKDSHFSKERADDLYQTWIEQSCAGSANGVLVADLDSQPAGYITCHLGEDGAGSIGLMAVAERARGLRLGLELINAALAYFAAHEMRSASVVTQESNAPARQSYERCGFTEKSRQLWFHYWSPGATKL